MTANEVAGAQPAERQQGVRERASGKPEKHAGEFSEILKGSTFRKRLSTRWSPRPAPVGRTRLHEKINLGNSNLLDYFGEIASSDSKHGDSDRDLN